MMSETDNLGIWVQKLETKVQNLERTVAMQQEAAKAQFREIQAKMTTMDALAARVAELEKPWYRRGKGAKASGHPEADKSTLLQRMEAFNS